jgi:glycosyltransferase involved in cell wall biosynthesis
MKVSVCIVTYNHARWIGQAVESALAQQVDFDYEIVIGEDRSTDGTREIVEGLAAANPGRIRALLRDANVGMNRNFAETLAACRGQYVAMLDGDDYWTAPDKLARQVAFLDNHIEYVSCFHDVEVLDDDGGRARFNVPGQRETSTLEDLLRGNFIVTSSVMFRNGLTGRLPDWFFTLGMGDWPVHVLTARHGKIRYVDEVMAVYRRHAGGALSTRPVTATLPAVIEACQRINEHFRFRYDAIIKERMLRCWYDLAVAHRERGELGAALRYAVRCLVARPALRYWRYRVQLPLRLAAPGLVRRVRGVTA